MTAVDGSRKIMVRTLEGFRAFTSCLDGTKEKGVIYGTGAWKMVENKGKPAFKHAYEMGKQV